MKLHLRKFNQFLEKTKQNLRKDEKEKIEFYLNKIATQKVFSFDECKEFKILVEKIRQALKEKEKEEFDWIAPTLLSFALAMIVDELGPLSK